MTRTRCAALLALAALAGLAVLPPARAYVEAPHSFGQVVALSSHIVLMRVTAVDRTKNAIIYSKVRDLKGTHPQKEIRHNIGKAGFEPREWQNVMAWAEVGKEAVFFHNGSASETCLGNYWYQCNGNPNDPNGWWGMVHGEPYLLRSFCGRIDKLVSAVVDVVAGKEVVVPCMANGNLGDLKAGKARIQRCRASLKLNSYDPKRDFAGWGGEDFRRLAGMPGFTHLSGIARVDPDARAAACLDFNGDGKLDACLSGLGKVALLQNGGEVLGEVGLPGVEGCRASAWADYDGDGLPDLLLATPAGPRLFTNLGKNAFRDDTRLLPKEAAYDLTCAAWIDQDGDGRPDILLGNGWHGLRLYRNKGKGSPAQAWVFADVSDEVGLGEKGIGADGRGGWLAAFDMDGDGKADLLYGAGKGVVARNTGKRFEAVAGSGLSLPARHGSPALGDFDGDGKPDLAVPHAGGVLLLRNLGGCKWKDATEEAGLEGVGPATSAAWGDLDNDGKPDLVVGRLRAFNRFYRNKGEGKFEDASKKIGFTQKVFNTQAVAVADINGDGTADVVFANEGQDSVVLLGNPAWGAKRTALSVTVKAKAGLAGGTLRLLDGKGNLAGLHLLGDGATARFAVLPGTYRAEAAFSDGQKKTKEITVAATHVRAVVE